MYIHGGGDHDSVNSDFYKIKLRGRVNNIQKGLLNSLKNQQLHDVIIEYSSEE